MRKILKKIFIFMFFIITILIMPKNIKASADNSLKYINIDGAKLSPDFQYNITNYNTRVGADIDNLSIDAKTSNNKAKIISIDGNNDLKIGNNQIKIVVEAENGNKANYIINVNKDGDNYSNSDDVITNSRDIEATNKKINKKENNSFKNTDKSLKKNKSSTKIKNLATKNELLNDRLDIIEEQYKSLQGNYNKILDENNKIKIVLLVETILFILIIIWLILVLKKVKRIKKKSSNQAKIDHDIYSNHKSVKRTNITSDSMKSEEDSILLNDSMDIKIDIEGLDDLDEDNVYDDLNKKNNKKNVVELDVSEQDSSVEKIKLGTDTSFIDIEISDL